MNVIGFCDHTKCRGFDTTFFCRGFGGEVGNASRRFPASALDSLLIFGAWEGALVETQTTITIAGIRY